MARTLSAMAMSLAGLAAHARADLAVQFDIDVSKDVKAISPLIYGSNFDGIPASAGVAFRRMGGNRLTGYNWENNASNAGSDWQQSSDNYMGGGNAPGKAMTNFQDTCLLLGQESIITLPAAGYVAKDKKGTVTEAEKAPSSRWVKVVYEKGSAFADAPDTTDDAVYTDEFVAFMKAKYGAAGSERGVRHWAVDNEPALWFYTHPRLHPDTVRAAEVLEKNAAVAAVVKKVDPGAEIFGGVFYGYAEYANMQGAPDWKTVNAGNKFGWYIDYFLDGMKKASDAAGKRLLDVLDIHWYPEATGGGASDHRITDGNATTANDRAARLQAPRSLWDPSYTEKSWIAQSTGGPVKLLSRIQASIDKYYPGTRLAITEYNYGEPGHVTGGLAEADFLGVMAANGVYAACLWPLGDDPGYLTTAFRLYRDYDGHKGAYGAAAAHASASDAAAASVFASFNPGGDEIHIIALNKSPTEKVNGAFTLASPVDLSPDVLAFGFDSTSKEVSAKPGATLSGKTFAYSLPPWSATHFVIKTAASLPSSGIRPAVRALPGRVPGPAYRPDGRLSIPVPAGEKAAPIPSFRRP